VTDFNEELAHATLMERPNSFFLGSAAPEDVDSDSGYSSPQHRQTTAVPSDHAIATAASVAVAPPPVIVPPPPQSASRVLETTHPVQQPAMLTYMPDSRHLPMIYAPYPFQSSPSLNMFIPATMGQNVSAKRLQSACRRVGVVGSGGPKVRQRSSSTRKAPKSLPHATKPSTNSQTTSINGDITTEVAACSEPALPFDDIDEFPYLLSAADGLVASQVASDSHPPNQLLVSTLIKVMEFLYFMTQCYVLIDTLSHWPSWIQQIEEDTGLPICATEFVSLDQLWRSL